MAQISTEAGMSVGHIYRYFANKDAIIAAIVREDVDEILCKMAEFEADVPDLREALLDRAEEGFVTGSKSEQTALMIEIRAEAARNPIIRAMVRESDHQLSQTLKGIIARAVGRPLDAKDLEARVEMFHLIFQGAELRAGTNPDIDRVMLAPQIRRALSAILQ